MHVRMLSLQLPVLLVLCRVDLVVAIQDPRLLFKVKQPDSHMVEVVIDVYSDLLTTCLALVQLCSREAQHCFDNSCGNKKKVGHSSTSLHTGKQDVYICQEFISDR